MISLREFEQKDAEQLVTILNDPEVVTYLSIKIPFPYTQEDALWWINEGSKQGIIRAITLNDMLIGCIGITPGEFEYAHSGEIGYWLSKRYWRSGFTLSAINQLVDYAFENTSLVRIFGAVFCENIASQKLLLKAGFEHEATLKQGIMKAGKVYDNLIFTKLKAL